jgi:hypothetical protein
MLAIKDGFYPHIPIVVVGYIPMFDGQLYLNMFAV